MTFSATDTVIVLVLMLVSSVVSCTVAVQAVNKSWQTECNLRGVGGYNKETGQWEWLVEYDKTKQPLKAKPADEIKAESSTSPVTPVTEESVK